ncbi:MAG TPA: epimerase, partial [Nocardioides sp.]|nr:epimerase [Nocardioides sp.]
RAANVIGPEVISPLTSYFRLPVVPTVLGHDPRLQFLHEHDLLDVLRHAIAAEVAGTFNVAGDGVLMLSQAVRRMQRPSVPLPSFAVGRVGTTLRSARVADFSPEQLGLLTYGRGVDTTRMRTELGFEPAFTTADAFADFAAPLPPTGGYADRLLGRVAQSLPEPAAPPAGALERPEPSYARGVDRG